MEFIYKAIDSKGDKVSGILTARDERAARKQLLEKFASILTIEDGAKTREKRKKPFKIGQDNVCVIFRRMATMMGSGVALGDTLEFMVDSEPDPRMHGALELLTLEVQSGKSLSEAMRHRRLVHVFDHVSIGMIALGERTGQIARITQKLADLKERQVNLTRSMISALTYPAVLFCVIVALAIMFMIILGPGEDGLFSAFGTEMPWPTRVVQQASNLLKKPWILVGGTLVIVGLIALFRARMRSSDSFRLKVHSTMLTAPIFGPLFTKIESARVLYVMADAFSVGLPAVQVLGMAKNVCGNDRVALGLKRVLKDFSNGIDLSETLAQQQVFPPIVLSMIEVGMESGKLDMVLAQACKTYEEDVKLTLDAVTQLAEPLLLIFAGLVSAFLALATLLPIIRMVENL